MNPKKATKDVSVTVPTPPADHASFKLFAKSRGISLAAFFRQAGHEYIEAHQAKRYAA